MKTVQHKRGTAAILTANNPTIAAGEIVVETDTNRFKVGDGSTAWVSLPYAGINASYLSAGTLADARLSSTVTAALTDARTPTSHVHGNLTNAGAIGSTSGQIVVTTASGVLTTAATIAAPSQVSGLAAVATSGSYNDLTNKPTTSASPYGRILLFG